MGSLGSTSSTTYIERLKSMVRYLCIMFSGLKGQYVIDYVYVHKAANEHSRLTVYNVQWAHGTLHYRLRTQLLKSMVG